MASTAELVTASSMDLEKTPKTFSTMSTKERLAYIREIITVEPLVAAYVLSATLCGPALLNLEFEKSCRSNLAYNDSVCDAIMYDLPHNYTNEIQEIQTMVSNMHSWQLPVQSVMPLILILFLGSYSDRHKLRKPFLLFPIFGEFFAVAGCILCVIFMKEWPLEAQGVLQVVVPSFFGGQAMLVMAVFAYIADVSTVEMRTMRVGVVQIVLTACLPIAQALSGVLYDTIGYIGVLLIAAALFLFGVLYGFFCIKEPRQPDLSSEKSFIMDAFDPKHAVDTFSLILKKSPGNNRAFVLAVLVVYFIYSTVNTGEASVFYQYAKPEFGWGPSEYSYFLTANTVIHLIGTLIGVPLFTKYLSLEDSAILALTILDKIIANIIFGLAKSNTMLYIATVVSIFTGITAIGVRSIGTKVVSQDDLGKAQSLFGIGEALGPAVAAPVYNSLIFVNTLQTLPSAFFYFGALLYGICLVINGWMYFIVTKRKKEKSPDEQNGGTNGTTNGKIAEEYQTTHI